MYIFRNAFISITRNKGRNLLIGIIIIVISSAVAVSLAIRNSAKKLISSYESQYEVEATIGINRESMRNEMRPLEDQTDDNASDQKEKMVDIFSSISNITVDQINNYGNSNYVKDYYYQTSVGVNSTSVEKVSKDTTESNTDDNNKERGMPGDGMGHENFQNISSNSDFTLIGYSKSEAMSDFINGKYKITDGEVFSDFSSDSCVINTELATYNNLSVGDEITLVDPDNSDNTVSLKIVGIYDEESSSNDDKMGMFTTSANTIITNSTVVEKLTNKNSDMKKNITPTFILTSRDVVKKFQKELTKKGLSEYLEVSTNLDQVDSATSTISNVYTFATTFLIITLIIGAIVLFVINMINIRERKYEIGVLRTIGMSKRLLTLQFISELLIVAVAALMLGAGIGAATSVPISNKLLQNEIQQTTEQKQNIGRNFGEDNFKRFDKVSGAREVQAFDSIDAVVDFKVLAQLFGLGILLTLISSTASMLSIQRFSPLSILKERG